MLYCDSIGNQCSLERVFLCSLTHNHLPVNTFTRAYPDCSINKIVSVACEVYSIFPCFSVIKIKVWLCAVMSEELAEKCAGFVTTVIQRGDVVPRLSCQSIESLLVELTNASPAKRAFDGFVQSASSALKSVKEKYVL